MRNNFTDPALIGKINQLDFHVCDHCLANEVFTALNNEDLSSINVALLQNVYNAIDSEGREYSFDGQLLQNSMVRSSNASHYNNDEYAFFNTMCDIVLLLEKEFQRKGLMTNKYHALEATHYFSSNAMSAQAVLTTSFFSAASSQSGEEQKNQSPEATHDHALQQ